MNDVVGDGQHAVRVDREGRGWVLRSRMVVARPRSEVFAFFSDAFNLEKVTPGLLRFAVLTPAPIEMREGTIIDYQLRVRGVPIRWRTRICEWDPPSGFVDEQLRGPYAWWVHRHGFADTEGGTLCTDEVKYRPIGGRLANALFVERDVRRIFHYRLGVMRELFSAPPALPQPRN